MSGLRRLRAASAKYADIRPSYSRRSELRGKVGYGYRGDLFVGAALVRVVAIAGERADAKAFDAFVEAMQI